MGRYLGRVGLALLGIAVFVTLGIVLENKVGLPIATSYRVACAVACLFLIWKFRSDYPQERWPGISLCIALFVNIAIFFTPLVDRPASRGELMLFGFPDAIIVLIVLIATYSVTNDRERAKRQQMILGLIVASVFCAGLCAAILLPNISR